MIACCARSGHCRLLSRQLLQVAQPGRPAAVCASRSSYGPHVQTLTGPPLARIARRRTATWFGPADVPVEFVYMPDAAEALLAIGLADGVDGEVFHLPGAAAITPRAFFGLASELSGGGRLRAIPAWMVRAAGAVHPAARAFADILHLWTHPILLDGARVAARFPALRATPTGTASRAPSPGCVRIRTPACTSDHAGGGA